MEILARPEILPIRHAVSASLSHGWLNGFARARDASGKTYTMKLSLTSPFEFTQGNQRD
jgi:hypothetical protein